MAARARAAASLAQSPRPPPRPFAPSQPEFRWQCRRLADARFLYHARARPGPPRVDEPAHARLARQLRRACAFTLQPTQARRSRRPVCARRHCLRALRGAAAATAPLRARASSFPSSTSSRTRWPACARWPRIRPRPTARSWSSTTAPATRPPRHCRGSKACGTTAGPTTAASSPPATTAPRSRVATPGVPQQRHRAAARLARRARCARSIPIQTPAWSVRSCCIRTDALQEAGGVVFRDGSAGITGASRRRTTRASPTCATSITLSGAAIAIPRALFLRLGGFDTRYAPAYYEDTDLAFSVRDAGMRVLYQPASRVVHDEGTSSGTDTACGVEGLPAAQPRAFRRASAHGAGRPCRSWHRADTRDAASPPAPGAGGRRGTPRPDHDSGSLRLVNLMRLLREEGAHVVFLPANRDRAGALHRRRCSRPVSKPGTRRTRQRAPAWLREHGPRFERVLLCRHYVASEFLPLLRRHAPRARDAVRHGRPALPARAAAPPNLPATRRCCARRCARADAELDLVARSDVTLVVSEAERALLAVDAPQADVEVLSNLHEVAGPGLPFAAAPRPGVRRRLPPSAERRCGALVHRRGVAAGARRQLPDVRFHCIGGDVPAGDPRARGDRDGVVMHGHVAGHRALHGRMPDLGRAAALTARASRARSTWPWRTGNRWSRRLRGRRHAPGRRPRRAGRRRCSEDSRGGSCACTKTSRCGSAWRRPGSTTCGRISRWTRRARRSGACSVD